MALTRVKDTSTNPRTLHAQAWASVTNCSFNNGTSFWLTGDASSSWILNLTNLPTFVDDRPDFIIEFSVFWVRGSAGGLPGFRVDGVNVSPIFNTTTTTTSVQYLTKVLLIRRDNAWVVYAASQATSSTAANNPALSF